MRHALAALLLWFAAAPSLAQSAMPAAEYAATAAAGDLFERTSAEYVLRDAGVSAEVKRFAQQMVVDHHNTSYRLRMAAEQDAVPPMPPAMTAVQQALIEQLRTAEGPERERIYLTQQLASHQRAHELHAAYARSGEAGHLRREAAATARIVEGHLRQLEGLMGGN
jgi:putative membrane protein